MWYYINKNKTVGPLNLEQLLNVIDNNTLIWNEEGNDSVWKKAELFPIIKATLFQNNKQKHTRKFKHLKYAIILSFFLVGYFFLASTIYYYYNAYISEYVLEYSLFDWLIIQIKSNFIDYMLFYSGLVTVIESFSDINPNNIIVFILAAVKLIGTLLIVFIWFRNFKKNKK
jgi:hypothetical protein